MVVHVKTDLMDLPVDVLKDILVMTVVYVSFEKSIIEFLYAYDQEFHKELQSIIISVISYFQMIHVKFVSRFKIKDMMMTIWDGMIREDAEHVMIIAAGLEIVLVEATHH